jgi:hypothetical protein
MAKRDGRDDVSALPAQALKTLRAEASASSVAGGCSRHRQGCMAK